jgi:hypothetical protein
MLWFIGIFTALLCWNVGSRMGREDRNWVSTSKWAKKYKCEI